MNIVENVSLSYIGASFGYMSISGIVGTSSNTMSNSEEPPDLIFRVVVPACDSRDNSVNTFGSYSVSLISFLMSFLSDLYVLFTPP